MLVEGTPSRYWEDVVQSLKVVMRCLVFLAHGCGFVQSPRPCSCSGRWSNGLDKDRFRGTQMVPLNFQLPVQGHAHKSSPWTAHLRKLGDLEAGARPFNGNPQEIWVARLVGALNAFPFLQSGCFLAWRMEQLPKACVSYWTYSGGCHPFWALVAPWTCMLATHMAQQYLTKGVQDLSRPWLHTFGQDPTWEKWLAFAEKHECVASCLQPAPKRILAMNSIVGTLKNAWGDHWRPKGPES